MRLAIPWILFVLIGGVGHVTGTQAKDPLLPRVSPESVGMTSRQLAHFDTLAAEYVGNGRIAGVVALVVRDKRGQIKGVRALYQFSSSPGKVGL